MPRRGGVPCRMAQPIVKTPGEVEAMRPACSLVAQALESVEAMIAPGVTTGALDAAVEALIRKGGGVPAFLGYPSPTPGVKPFPASICASVNEEVVHGIPGDRALCEGDLIAVDVGVELNGFFGDAARTFPVGTVTRRARRLLSAAEDALAAATAEMRPGRTLSHVCGRIQTAAEAEGFSVVRQFVGHGIGRAMHEPPQVPNYASRTFREGRFVLAPGWVLAVEPMVNAGGAEVLVRNNGWTVITKDRSLSVHVENTIAVSEDGPVVLTA